MHSVHSIKLLRHDALYNCHKMSVRLSVTRRYCVKTAAIFWWRQGPPNGGTYCSGYKKTM